MARKEERASWPQVYIPRDKNDKESVKTVAVNGRVYMIRKGEWVSVPPEVYEAIEFSRHCEYEADKRVADMIADKEGKRVMGS